MKVLSTIIILTALAAHASAEIAEGNKGQLVQGPEIQGPIIEAPGKAEAEPLVQVAVQEFIPANQKPQTEAIPEKYAGEKAVAIKLEGLKRDEAGLLLQVTLRFINPSDKPFQYTGYSAQSPITKRQQWVDGEWVEQQKFLRCGTGLRNCTVAPGQSAVFHITLQPEQLPARIGLTYSTNWKGSKPQTVWSEKIES